MISFLRPWWLLALAAVAAVVAGYLWRQRRRRVHAVRFSNTDLLRRIAPAGLGWRRHLPAAALAACLLALVTAMARPTMERPEPVERATIMLAIDVSLSMEADDVTPTRLRAAQQAAIDFVNDLPPAHNLGVVSFAGTARVLVPPGTDRQAAVRAIESLQLSEATATGEAVFTCLEAIEAMPTYGDEAPPPARILLLTDGYRTYGRPVEQAGEAAAEAGVPVYTVAFGTDQGMVEIGGRMQRVPVDRAAMARLAQETGGRFYEAASTEELAAVYEDMGGRLAYRMVPKEVTGWLVGGALLFGLAGAGLGLRFTGRLP
ncbi:MAG TPA: VWA domain-containing protein [Natronosporangium sp.]|nr:VWA domain-containing protein [Natronosporangium sp.]